MLCGNIPVLSNVGEGLGLAFSADESLLTGISEELDNDEGDCGDETGDVGAEEDGEHDWGEEESKSVATLSRLLGLSVLLCICSSAGIQGSDISASPHQPMKKKTISKDELDKVYED